MNLRKISSKITYFLLITFFCLSLVLITSSTSLLVADFKNQEFLSKQKEYFNNLNTDNKFPHLNVILDGIDEKTKMVLSLKILDIILALLGIVMFAVCFVFLYSNAKQEILENKYDVKMHIVNTTSFTVLLSLFFSIGIAFAFVSYSIESEYTQTSTVILSNINRDNSEIQMNLLNKYLNENFGQHVSSIFNASYFFEIFLCFSIGLLFKNKDYFFSRAFFCAGITTASWWVFSFLLKPLISIG